MIILENVSKVFKIPHERTKTLFHRIISVTSSGYTYEKLYALKDISIHVPQGQFLGIIGKNGSGKSTLLRIIAGIYRPTNGKVHINESVAPMLELGLGFDNDFSCKDNIYVYGALLGFSRKQLAHKVDEILHFAELERFADAKLEMLSSGMRMRLAFSIAIQSVAPIILVDEVLAVGDKIFTEKCRNAFRTIHSDGRTIILVTHSMNLIKEFCDRVLILQNGALVADGPPDNIIKLYNDKILSSQLDEIIDVDLIKPDHKHSIHPVHEKSATVIEPLSVVREIQPKVPKIYGYDAEKYWGKRLNENFNLRGVGNIIFNENYNKRLYQQRISTLKRIIRRYDIPLADKKVLDVGCGTGYFSNFYLANKSKVFGIDISSTAIEQLSKIYPQAIFKKLDISSKKSNIRDKYDIVHVFSTTFHIVEDQKFNIALKNCIDFLKNGGYLFITDRFNEADFAPAPHVKFRSIKQYEQIKEMDMYIIGIFSMHHFMNRRLPLLSTEVITLISPILSCADRCINFIGVPKGKDIKLMVARKRKYK